jgi:hypothetical protein
VHSTVWQRIQKDEGAETADGETKAHGIVAIIADYVRSIQSKPGDPSSTPN